MWYLCAFGHITWMTIAISEIFSSQGLPATSSPNRQTESSDSGRDGPSLTILVYPCFGYKYARVAFCPEKVQNQFSLDIGEGLPSCGRRVRKCSSFIYKLILWELSVSSYGKRQNRFVSHGARLPKQVWDELRAQLCTFPCCSSARYPPHP